MGLRPIKRCAVDTRAFLNTHIKRQLKHVYFDAKNETHAQLCYRYYLPCYKMPFLQLTLLEYNFIAHTQFLFISKSSDMALFLPQGGQYFPMNYFCLIVLISAGSLTYRFCLWLGFYLTVHLWHLLVPFWQKFPIPSLAPKLYMCVYVYPSSIN